MKFLFICLFLFCIPTYSHAAIIINEIAWMGTENSANDEWIELYNNGGAQISIDGWVLKAGGGLEIVLAGAIGAGQYVVLERTDDNSAPGSAFMIYTGALSNTGDTLTLYRADNAIEDSVAGGEDWQNIGGDNTTKETAQYTTNGWITAVPTAGERNQENVSVLAESDEDTQEESNGNSSGSSAVSTLYFTPRELKLDISAPSRVYVNQEISIRVEPSGLSDGILNSLNHRWNFGDVTTATRKEVSKRFAFPGEYVVTLHSQYKDYEAYARHTVLVLPVSFSITKGPQGNVQVHNNARYEVDISGYKIAGDTTLTFPQGSVLLPNATITIPEERIKFTHNVTLFDNTSVQVASLYTFDDVLQVKKSVIEKEDSQQVAVAQNIKIQEIVPVTASESSFNFLSETKEGNNVQQQDVQATTTPQEVSQTVAFVDDISKKSASKLPYFILLVVIGTGILSVFASNMKA
jgi:hypothetical protein